MQNKILLSQAEFNYSHGSTPTAVLSLETFSGKAGPASVFSAVLFLSGREMKIYQQ